MILAAVGDTPYNIILLLHVLTALMALSPMFVYPLLPGQMRPIILPEQQRLVVTMLVNMRSLYGPALIITGLLGFALAGLSNDAHSMRDGWVITAAVIWVLMNGVLHGMILPAVKTMGSKYLNTTEAEKVVESAVEALSEDTLKHLDTRDAPHLMASVAKHAITAAAEHAETPVAEQIHYPASTAAEQAPKPGGASPAERSEESEGPEPAVETPESGGAGSASGRATRPEDAPAVGQPPQQGPIGTTPAEYIDTAAAEHIDITAAEHMAAYTTKRLQQGSGIMTFLLITQLWLMIWQPDLFQV